jgi:Flp pilus assembly protein TadB
MYSIFHALDPNERLPRELVLEGKRWRALDWHLMLWILGVTYLPALMLIVVLLGALHVNPLLAFGVAGAALIAVYVFVLATKRP